MPDADGIERLHRRAATRFAEVTCMVVGQAQNVEACVSIVRRVTRRRTEQVASSRVLAFLAGLAAVDEDALEVAERNIG